MAFTNVNEYNGLVGRIFNEEFKVQTLPDGRMYLVNWDKLSNPHKTVYRIVKEIPEKEKAIATLVKDPYVIYSLKNTAKQ